LLREARLEIRIMRKLTKDSIEDYAQRKVWSIEKAERWLRVYLNY